MKHYLYLIISFTMCVSLLSCERGCDDREISYFIANKSQDTIYIAQRLTDRHCTAQDVISVHSNRGFYELAPDSLFIGTVWNSDIPYFSFYVVVNSKETMRKYTEEEIFEKGIADEFFTWKGTELERHGFLMVYRGKEEEK